MCKAAATHNLVAVPESIVTTPITGATVVVNHWWLCKDGCVFKSVKFGAYQHNRRRDIFEIGRRTLIREFGFDVKQIPLAYIPEH